MADEVKGKAVEDWPGLAGWLEAYPRDDIECVDINMAETAQLFATSVNTIKSWLSQVDCPMPYVKQGGNGREYVLRLSWCLAWRAHQDAEKENRAQKLSRLQMQLSGLDLQDDDGSDVLNPKQIKEVADARMRHAEAGLMLGTLTEVDGVYRLLENIFIIVRDTSMGASDRLERELNLSPAQAQRTERVMEEMLVAMGDKLRENVIGKDFEPNLNMSKQLVIKT